jgi:hypothetical protein
MDTAGTVTIAAGGKSVSLRVPVSVPKGITQSTFRGFLESDGHVSIEAEHYTTSVSSGTNRWMKIEDYGHTLSGMRATSAIDAAAAVPGKNSPCLEYRCYLLGTGKVNVVGTFGPTLNYLRGRGVRYAVSMDDETPLVVTLVQPDFIAQHGNMEWEKVVGDNARYGKSTHTIAKPGYHTLKIWMVDTGVVLQKLVVDRGGLRPSYLGPPESFHKEGK